MNEKLQYASMLEIPVNSCNVTYTKIKRRRAKRKQSAEKIKQEVLDKVNSTCIENEQENTQSVEQTEQLVNESIVKESKQEKVQKPKRKIMVTASMVAIGILVAVIFLTNAIYQEGGLAVFFKNAFSSSQSAQVEQKDYSDYSPAVALANASVNLNEGLATLTGSGSVYSPTDGVVSSVEVMENGKYKIEISHGNAFTSVLSGLDFAYSLVGDTVYGNIPVGYLKGGEMSMCFCKNDGSMIVDYQIVDGTILWVV